MSVVYRPTVADIIGITDILSQKYRYIVDLKKPTWTIPTLNDI